MMRRTPALALPLLLPLALLSACGVPLGPGYTVKKQQLEARWTGTPELAVRGAYRLQNTGKTPLNYIEVTLPPEPRRSGLQVSLDGSPVATQPADELAPAGTVRIPISPALAQKKKRDLLIEYRLAGSVGDVSATPSFYLETRGWYPALREREGLFGSGGAPPEKWDLRVTVPRDFLVHASGQQKGRKRRDDSVEHRFRQRRGEDFDPFVVAGRYHEQRSGHEVVFWGPRALTEQSLNRLGDRIRRTSQQYDAAFGRLHETPRVLVVTPPSERIAELVFAGFPGGVFITAGRTGVVLPDEDALLRNLDAQLLFAWFYHAVTPSPEAQLLFYEGLPPYGATIADERYSTPQGRATFASGRIAFYEEVGGQESEPRFFLNEADTSPKRIVLARAKGPLFFLALEDRYGKEATRKALGRLAHSLRGRQFNTNDLRVAIHLETGEDPAEFFRQWLNQPGIPEDFRKRYEKQPPGSR